METDESRRETSIQGDVYGMVTGDHANVTMHFHQHPPESSLSPRERQIRLRMIAKVRSFWITGVLEKSLHGAALMALGLEERYDVQDNPWHLVLEQPNKAAEPLPPGTQITDVYDEALGGLLILGEPGSGKTTLLLELARHLLLSAENDEDQPLPMIFNLSPWAEKRYPLTTWLVEELNSKYQVPRKLGKGWVESDMILPLLDGLDEVAKEYRLACAEAINSYRLQHGLVSMILCSRKAEYLELAARVQLQSAVVIQPLTEQQIDDYLSSAGGQLKALRMMLREDQVLYELAMTPLMLSVITLAYAGRRVEDLGRASSPETLRQYIFAQYVERMLQRRGKETRYTHEQTIHWLTWLAQRLIEHNQVEFYLERMQPMWLSESAFNNTYPIRVELIGGLIYGLLIGGIWGTFLGLGMGLFFGLGMGLFCGLLCGFVGGLIFGYLDEIKPAEKLTWSWRRSLEKPYNALEYLLGRPSETELRSMSAIGLFIGGFMGLLDWLQRGVVLGPVRVLVFGLIGGVVGGLLDGFSSEMLNKQNIVKPNQGLRHSLRNSMLIGLTFTLSVGLVLGLYFGLDYGLDYSVLGLGLASGLTAGLASGLVVGGAACIQHYVLRWLLWRTGCLPWNYPRFLDYAAERILLRKVGGGYIFVHRLLMEYFASLETDERTNATMLT